MRAIEFIAKEEKGTIKITKQYIGQFKKQFRVIILDDFEENVSLFLETIKKDKKKRVLKAMKITTKDIVFNRDEANER